jgi:hypothetical protein
MARASSDAYTAVLEGGPLDGREHPVQVDTDDLLVVMTDGAQHRYVVSERVRTLADGRVASIFEYRGRHYPLRSADHG